MTRTADRIATLESIYAQVPELKCKGLCHEACGPIPAANLELDRMQALSGRPLSHGKDGTCSYLGEDKRCSVYAVRPLICRLFGAVEALKCPHGCIPARYLHDNEVKRMTARLHAAGGFIQVPEL